MTDAPVGDHRDSSFEGLRAFVDRCHLRDPHAAYDPGGTDGSGTDADLHGVGSGVSHREGALGGADVARDDVRVGVVLDEPADHLDDARRMPVRGVNDHNVHVLAGQGFHALVVARADRRTGAEAVAIVPVVQGLDVLDERLHVAETVETDKLALLDEREFSDLVPHHDVVRLAKVRVFRGRHQFFGHHLFHRGVRVL